MSRRGLKGNSNPFAALGGLGALGGGFSNQLGQQQARASDMLDSLRYAQQSQLMQLDYERKRQELEMQRAMMVPPNPDLVHDELTRLLQRYGLDPREYVIERRNDMYFCPQCGVGEGEMHKKGCAKLTGKPNPPRARNATDIRAYLQARVTEWLAPVKLHARA